MEITKALREVIIAVISSQRGQPPSGKGRRASAGKAFQSLSSRREETYAPGGLSQLTYFFFVPDLPRDSVAGCQTRVYGTVLPLCSSSAYMLKSREKKRGGKKRKERKQRNVKEKQTNKKTIASFHQTFLPFSFPAPL